MYLYEYKTLINPKEEEIEDMYRGGWEYVHGFGCSVLYSNRLYMITFKRLKPQ